MIIAFEDVNGVAREHDIGSLDLETWLAGYTTNWEFPIANLTIKEWLD